ncbi:hypothetical protein [Sorangium sp. So ce1335]|uniref:hypothetical protein n=1 Tax=Sorangium sp. So ce1335 TaxID=3133335 RepID=UPI003F603A26
MGCTTKNVNSDGLVSLKGIDELETVRLLEPWGNPNLSSLEGLEKLRTAGQAVIDGNPELTCSP